MASKTDFVSSEKNVEQSLDTRSMSQNGDVPEGEMEKVQGATGLKLWLKKLSVETGGIERVTDEDRAGETSKVWNACTFWWVLVMLFRHLEGSIIS
jgi:hypothetical protein